MMDGLERAIVDVVHTVCEAMLGLDIAAVAAPGSPGESPRPAGRGLVGWIRFAGAWSGAVVLRGDAGFARACASILLEDDACDDDAIRDAFGELTNMIAGNLKAVLPAPSRLSLPAVAADGPPPPALPVAELERVHFQLPGGHRLEVVMSCDPPAPPPHPPDRRLPADTIR